MPSDGATELVVERVVRIRAQPETIFAFLTDPSKMVRWMGVHAALDPRPGGVFHVNISGWESVSGRYVEVVPYERVAFTWGWDGGVFPVAPGVSTVEIALEPDGDETELRLRHRGLVPGMQRFHGAGWDRALGRLAAVGAGRDPGPDPNRSLPGLLALGRRSLPPRYLALFALGRARTWLRRLGAGRAPAAHT